MADDIHPSSPYNSLHIQPKSKCIRLLHIHPINDSEAEISPIRGDLFVADLAARPQPAFTALSYVWGAFAPTPHQISCGDYDIPISANGYSALLHLRRMLGQYTIWIDAVCINQKDDVDKAKQIPLMGDIYSGASTVYIWLGEGSPQTDRAIRYLSATGFQDYFFENGDPDCKELSRPRFWAAIWSHVWMRWSLKETYVPHKSNPNEPFGTHKMRLQYFERVRSRLGLGVVSDHDIETFFLCDWASRIWTFQEIVLANNPVAVCGDSHIFWSQLAMGVTFLSSIYGRNHARRMWMEIILSRVYFHDKNKSEHGLEGNSSKYERIIRYWKFVRSIKRFCRRWYFWCKFLGVLAGFVTTLVMLRLIGRKGVTSESDLAFLPFPICLILSIGISLYHYLSFNPGFPRLSDPLLEESLKMRKDVYGTLLDTLRIRKATNSRDMSFGLRSVLRRSTQSSLPPVDYTASISSTYMHLTCHLLTETNSLHFLALAAQANFPDAPSWVPDFSKSLLPVEPQKDFDPGSQSSWHLDPATGSDILTVKGAFIDNVVSKRRLIQTNTTYQESDWTAHLTNLKTMLLSVKIWEYSNMVHYLNEVFTPEFTDELYGSRNAQSRTRLLFTYHDYVHLLKDYRYSDPKDLLQDLIRDCQSENLWNTGRRSHSTADIFNLHIYLCNKMCEKYTLIETETGAGFRPNHIEIGDRIILVPGLPEPLIVRPSGSSVRIVALAGAYSIWDMTEMDRSRKAEGIELEEINIS